MTTVQELRPIRTRGHLNGLTATPQATLATPAGEAEAADLVDQEGPLTKCSEVTRCGLNGNKQPRRERSTLWIFLRSLI